MKYNSTDEFAVPSEMLEPGTSVHNCEYHNPDGGWAKRVHSKPWPWYGHTTTIWSLYYDDHNIFNTTLPSVVCEQHRHLDPDFQIWHVLGPVSSGSNSPTTSDCAVVCTLREKRTLYRVSLKEGLREIAGYLIKQGPQGTKNKYLAINDEDRWWDTYIAVGKFADHGVFLDESEALRYLNELLSKELLQLQERIVLNHMRLVFLNPEVPHIGPFSQLSESLRGRKHDYIPARLRGPYIDPKTSG